MHILHEHHLIPCIDNIIYYVYNDVLSGDKHAGRYHNLSKY